MPLPGGGLTEGQQRRIARCYAMRGTGIRHGKSGRRFRVDDLAAHFGVHPNTIRNVARRAGLAPRRGSTWRTRSGE